MTPEEIEEMPPPSWLPDEIDRMTAKFSKAEEIDGQIYVLLASMLGREAAIPAHEGVQKMFVDIHVLFRDRLLSALSHAYPSFDIVQCWTDDENGILVMGLDEVQSVSIAEGVESILDVCYDHCMREINDGLN